MLLLSRILARLTKQPNFPVLLICMFRSIPSLLYIFPPASLSCRTIDVFFLFSRLYYSLILMRVASCISSVKQSVTCLNRLCCQIAICTPDWSLILTSPTLGKGEITHPDSGQCFLHNYIQLALGEKKFLGPYKIPTRRAAPPASIGMYPISSTLLL